MRDLSDKIASFLTAIAAMGAWVSSWFNRRKIREVHVMMNSRLTQLLKITRKASFKAGAQSERNKRGRSRRSHG